MVRTDFIKKLVDALQMDAQLEEIPKKIATSFVPVIPLEIPPKIVFLQPVEAGNTLGAKVPAGKKWKVLHIGFRYVSDVNAGNRELVLEVTDGIAGNDILFIAVANFQPASKTLHYTFGPGLSLAESESGLFQTIPLPERFYHGGDEFFIFDDANIAVGDAFSVASFIVEETDDFDGREQR